MLINIEDKFVNHTDIASLLPEHPDSSATAGQFEFEPHTKITLHNGQSFTVTLSPLKVADLIDARVSATPDKENIKAYLEPMLKELRALNKHLEYMAEMISRFSMHITDGREVFVRKT